VTDVARKSIADIGSRYTDVGGHGWRAWARSMNLAWFCRALRSASERPAARTYGNRSAGDCPSGGVFSLDFA
jgi:hypothetical protein